MTQMLATRPLGLKTNRLDILWRVRDAHKPAPHQTTSLNGLACQSPDRWPRSFRSALGEPINCIVLIKKVNINLAQRLHLRPEQSVQNWGQLSDAMKRYYCPNLAHKLAKNRQALPAHL